MKKLTALFLTLVMIISSTAVFAEGEVIGYREEGIENGLVPGTWQNCFFIPGYSVPVTVGDGVAFTVSNVVKDFFIPGDNFESMTCYGNAEITFNKDAESVKIEHRIPGETKSDFIYPDGKEGETVAKKGAKCVLDKTGIYRVEVVSGNETKLLTVQIYMQSDKMFSEIAVPEQVADKSNGYNAITADDLGKMPEIIVPTPAPAPEEINCVATTSELVIDGTVWSFEAYNINDNNYFKLRDIAMTFTWGKSENSFEVTWSEEKNAINLITKTPYTPVGGECGGYDLALGDWPSEKVPQTPIENLEILPSTAKIYVDGAEVSLKAYNIDGNNYFKLRDLADAINFGVMWNEAENRIYVDTLADYVDGL